MLQKQLCRQSGFSLVLAAALPLAISFSTFPDIFSSRIVSASANHSPHLKPRAGKTGRRTTEAATAEQVANIPYFTLRDGMSSTLTLQNRAPSESIATVTIFSTDGARQDLAPIRIAPHSLVQLSLGNVIEGEQFRSGNLQVAFTGPPMMLAAQISITSTKHRLSYESRAQAAMDFLSTKLNGILWLPRRSAEGSLAVTNVAPTSVTVHLQFAGKQETLTLPPRNTEVVKLNETPDGPASTPMLIKLEHDGLPGEILTTGFVLDSGSGYSSTFTMFDSAMMNSAELAGVDFRFGVANPAEGFPEGTAFRAPLLLANVGAQPANAQISVDYTTTSTRFDHVAVKKLSLAPGEVRRIELSEELARLGIAGPVQEAGVEVSYGCPSRLTDRRANQL